MPIPDKAPATCIDPFTAVNGRYAIIERAPAFITGQLMTISEPMGTSANSSRLNVPSFESFFSSADRPIEQSLPFAPAGGYAFIEEDYLPLD
jgi:hypothetical protein